MNCDAAIGQVLNGGSGFEISMGDTARLIADIMGSKIEIIEDPNRLRPAHSEVKRLLADNSRLRLITGWQPQYAELGGFRKGLKKTIEWFLGNKNIDWYASREYVI